MRNKLDRNFSPPLKASFWFMIANFMQQGITIFSVPIFTRILTEYDYGIISVFTSWTALLSVIVTLSLVGGVYNNGQLDFKDDRDAFTSSMLGLSSVTTIFFIIIYTIFKVKIDNILQLSPILMIIMILGFFVNPAMGFWMSKQRFEYKYKLSIALSLFATILSPIFSYIAIQNYPSDKVLSKIIGGAIVTLSVNTVIYIHLIKKGKKFINLYYWKYALVFNLPLIPHYLSSLALSQADRIMIANMSGNDKAGIYSVAYSAASLVGIIWNSINASWIPWTLKKMKDNKYSEIGTMAKPILLISAGACLGIIVFAPEAIKLLAPPNYYEAIYVIPPVVVGLYFTFVYTLFANIEFYHKKTVPIMIASVSAAMLNIGLNFILIPRFGYIAAAYTTLLGYVFLCVMHYIFLRKVEKNKIYDMKFIILLSAILIILSAVIMSFYNNLIIRYVIIIIILIIVIICRKKIQNVFSKIKKHN